ncbi:hypothetical protein H8356DRAFT_1636667 [Neocallimastix lanati (nom. inval.)]|jgi:hypothetical protein|nr:hypothetical protein H8356DRAFT_1636667 [Neocallimastix sp. JGI-2020a]
MKRKRSNSLSSIYDRRNFTNKENNEIVECIVKKQISVITDLKNELEKENQEKNKLASYNEILNQQLEESQRAGETSYRPQNNDRVLIHEFIENLKNLNFQCDKTKIKEKKIEIHKTYEFVNNRLFLFEKIGNSDVYERFPTATTVRKVANNWCDISEIRYANDISWNTLTNYKAILFRNEDKSCYIILKIKNTKHGIFYGVNGRNIEIGNNSFSVYELSKNMESFMDNISRLIYEDRSGLYFVPAAENSIETIIDKYQQESKFNFNGSVLKISTLDGSITYNDNPITENNFFDNWILKEIEIQKPTFNGFGEQGWTVEKITQKVLSTKRPKPREILRNFYPPGGSYQGIFLLLYQHTVGWMNIFDHSSNNNFNGINWLNRFIFKRNPKDMNSSKCENLVINGAFAKILKIFSDIWYDQKVYIVIQHRLKAIHKNNFDNYNYFSIEQAVQNNIYLFKDIDFVKSLKPEFAELEKDYKNTKESDKWLLFEIVKNL